MTKQDIEKAIENGASVWYIVNNELAEIDLSCNFHEIKDNELLTWYDKYSKDYYTHRKKLEDLYKSQAEAEHYLHHANVERVETLPFLTWEEFTSDIMAFNSFSFITEDGYRASLMYDKASGLIILDSGKEIKTYGATEANFYKAYDECVRLFRSEE